MVAAEPPAVVAPATVDKLPDVLVVSRDTRSDVLASSDTPLPLIKAGRTEDALLRQAIFLTGTLTVVRPATGPGQETLRWSYQPYLQRQLCFTSITGQFSCAAAELEELPAKADGEAPAPATSDQAMPAQSPAAEDARTALVTDLRARADAMFEDDRRLVLSPMLKAAGVRVRRIPVSAVSVAR
jgi:hypothetical protein